MTGAATSLRTCSTCGLVQVMPAVPSGYRACCARCRSGLPGRTSRLRSNSRTAAFAAAALLLYPPAIMLPMIRIEQFGHHHHASILSGTWTLLTGQHLFIGIVVLLCSVVLPLGKLLALLVLASSPFSTPMLARHHRAFMFHIVEWTGRWGMLDVVLVAILVAALKLGDVVQVTPGPAAAAFTACVVLNLLAAACFDPHRLWEARA